MKKEDVCYSWWALSSLVMIKKSAWIDHKKLAEFILSAAVRTFQVLFNYSYSRTTKSVE
jgi:prenyltransferase beta subunit